jgi:lysylphosphatidylglycerol synthetase-like protein (DUF2156 family)
VLIFLALNAGAVLAALVLAYATGALERTGRLLFFTLCGYLIVVHSVALAAGVVGRLAPGGAVVVLALVLAIALSIAAWRRRRLAITQEPPVEGDLRFTSLTLVCPLVAIITGGVWMWPHVAGPTRLWIWDDYTYTWSIPRCGSGTTSSPPRCRRTCSRCRRGIRSPGASSRRGSCCRSRDRAATPSPG